MLSLSEEELFSKKTRIDLFRKDEISQRIKTIVCLEKEIIEQTREVSNGYELRQVKLLILEKLDNVCPIRVSVEKVYEDHLMVLINLEMKTNEFCKWRTLLNETCEKFADYYQIYMTKLTEIEQCLQKYQKINSSAYDYSYLKYMGLLKMLQLCQENYELYLDEMYFMLWALERTVDKIENKEKAVKEIKTIEVKAEANPITDAASLV